MQKKNITESWKIKSTLQIYSKKQKKWIFGEIINIYTDEEGEWLVIQNRNHTFVKRKKRDSCQIRTYYHLETANSENIEESLRKQLSNCLIFGYLRSAENVLKNLIIPHEITFICFNYYFISNSDYKLAKEEEIHLTLMSLTISDKVEIYSSTHSRWCLGKVTDVINDEDGEWLKCIYQTPAFQTMTKTVHRSALRPIQDDDDSSSESDEGDISNAMRSKPRLTYPATSRFRSIHEMDILDTMGTLTFELSKILISDSSKTEQSCQDLKKLLKAKNALLI